MLRSAGASGARSRPSSRSSPPLGSSSPAMMFMSVLLPHPEGPTRTRNSPCGRLIEMSRSILFGPKLFCTLTRSSAAMVLPLDRTGHQAADKIFAGQQIHHQRRNGGDESAGEMHVVFLDAGGAVYQVVQRNRDRERAVIAERSAEQEFVPDVGELPDDCYDDDR